MTELPAFQIHLEMASDLASDPIYQELVLSILDICHRFRAYPPFIGGPAFYHSLSLIARPWVGVQTDGDWASFVEDVCLLSLYSFSRSNFFYLGR